MIIWFKIIHEIKRLYILRSFTKNMKIRYFQNIRFRLVNYISYIQNLKPKCLNNSNEYCFNETKSE